MLIEKIVVLGLATLSLGTIKEADGVQEHSFWLLNAGDEPTTLVQGYTSCGCTTITFDKDHAISPGDSTLVTLRFNPRGKGGEFEERGTVVYGQQRQRVSMALVGTCITSEETLLKQYPIRISPHTRLTSKGFDLGIMHPGDSKERHVSVLHREQQNRKELIPITITIDQNTPKGLQHIPYDIRTLDNGKPVRIRIMFDVMVK